MSLRDLQQGSSDWIQARIGKCTGSRVLAALSFLRNGQSSAERRRYMVDILCERLTGSAVEHYVSPAMQWGTDTEPLARAAYEHLRGVDVDTVGIVVHGSIVDFSVSPDGLVGDEGMVQFKCPLSATHVQYLLAGVVPDEYLPQITAEMACCPERKWIDFVSFDPRLPKHLQIFVKRLTRDDLPIAEVEDGVRRFLANTEQLREELFASYPPLPEEVDPAMDDRSLDDLGITDADMPAWMAEVIAEEVERL